jgi:hypothetical protein
MKLREYYLKIWEILNNTTPEGETQSTETEEILREKRENIEYGDKSFCIGDSDWCIL